MHWENKDNETLYLISIPDYDFDRVSKPNITEMKNIKGIMTTKNAGKTFLIEYLDDTNEMVLSSLTTVIENDIRQVNGKLVILGNTKIMTSSKASLARFLRVKLKEKTENFERQIEKIKTRSGCDDPSLFGHYSKSQYDMLMNRIKNIREYYDKALKALREL